MYHNTTGAAGAQLHDYRKKTSKQDKIILDWFKRHLTGSPSQCWAGAFRQSAGIHITVPITSVRRSITNLTESGHLIKTDRKRTGLFGRPEYIWTIAEQHRQTDLFKE